MGSMLRTPIERERVSDMDPKGIRSEREMRYGETRDVSKIRTDRPSTKGRVKHTDREAEMSGPVFVRAVDAAPRHTRKFVHGWNPEFTAQCLVGKSELTSQNPQTLAGSTKGSYCRSY